MSNTESVTSRPRPVRGEFIKSRGDRCLVQPATVLLPAIRGKTHRRPGPPESGRRPSNPACVLCLLKSGTERESDGWAILGSFLNRVNSDEFDVGNRHPLGLQEQVAEILIPATTVQQHLGEFLERNQPLPLQLLYPLVQVAEHGLSFAKNASAGIALRCRAFVPM